VSIPADTFAAFVSVLSEALDDHDATSAELADRLALSRSHLDHLVSAVAGESPVRLRRRVLLERAAWRLTTTDRTILDVAVEAGYGSHEAFGRAFSQAYGLPPAAWRSHPTVIRLPSENGVHFHPPTGLRLPAPTRRSGDMSLVTPMVEHHIWVIGEMLRCARSLDEQQLDRPITLSVAGIDCDPTVRSLLSRLVGQMDMWNTVLAMGDYDFAIEQHETLEELAARLARVGPAFLEAVRDVDQDGRMHETFVDVCGDSTHVFTYGGMIAHVLTYAAHRRTLVAGAIESAGVTDLTDDPLVWFSQERMTP
jgi:AraC family transcriptional regulator